MNNNYCKRCRLRDGCIRKCKDAEIYEQGYNDGLLNMRQEVEFKSINDIIGPIIVTTNTGNAECFTADGKMHTYNDDCLLFPSKEQRDWSKFNPKKPKFDPKTFQPFDKVLIKRGTESYHLWFPDFISLPPNDVDETILCMNTDDVVMVIPYNEETKNLVDTNDEAPEFYRYWED